MLGKKKKVKSTRIDTLIGKNTVVKGDITYHGGLHIDGQVVGNIDAQSSENNVLIVSESGRVQGHVYGPVIILNGQVDGDVNASVSLELAGKAKVRGDVHYKLLEMEVGAEVNGSLIHQAGAEAKDEKSKVDKDKKIDTEQSKSAGSAVPPMAAK